jgi:hypothetical protein
MMGFFSEIGFLLPQFPYIAHSLGWEAEDMERNVSFVEGSDALKNGARDLVARAAEMSRCLIDRHLTTHAIIDKGGRKASA